MACSVSRFFWRVCNAKECSGTVTKVVNLQKNVDDMLAKHKSSCRTDQPVTESMLLLNRVTPHPISMNEVGGLDVCAHHQGKLTVRSIFFQRKCCEISGCDVKATRRVSIAASSTIFIAWGQHVPIGAGLCDKHRKKLSHTEESLGVSGDVDGLSALSEDGLSALPENENGYSIKIEDNSTRPRRMLLSTENNSLCAVTKSVSTTSESRMSDSQDTVPDSQVSNYSDACDPDEKREIKKFEFDRKEAKLATLNKSLNAIGISSSLKIDSLLCENVPEVKLWTVAELVSSLVHELLQLFIWDKQPVVKDRLLELTSDQIQKAVETKSVSFEWAVLESIKKYVDIIKNDLTKEGTFAKKTLIECLSGSNVTDNNLLSHLAEYFGFRKPLVLECAKTRAKIEDTQKLIPVMQRLERKTPEGEGIISLEWKLRAVRFYENDEISDVVKGHHAVYKERIKNADGSNAAVFLRQKRILKFSPLKLLGEAKTMMDWPFGIGSLLRQRPVWVLLPSSRYLLGCLCEICHNLSLQLRALNNFITKGKRGTSFEKSALLNFSIIPSNSALVDLLLHPKEPGKALHSNECFHQNCDQSLSKCGEDKFHEVFGKLADRLGDYQLELFQHVKISYVNDAGKKCTKYELTRLEVSLSSLLESMRERLFLKKECYLLHCLKKILGKEARQDLRGGLKIDDCIIYSDFSKEYEIRQPEMLKHEAFGASRWTIQLIPVVCEMRVKPPTSPQNLKFDSQCLQFSQPKLLGGSNIQHYEVDVEDPITKIWYRYGNIVVKKLSSQPDIPTNFFGTLGGHLSVRIYATNLAGRGDAAEMDIELSGNSSLDPTKLVEVTETHFEIKYITFWEEFFYLSDHGDAYKDWKTIRAVHIQTLANIRAYHNRDFKRAFPFTDTGGENWGTQPLANYSWSLQDLGLYSVWCPTPAQHSGQPSDSAGGVLKRDLTYEGNAGNLRGIVCAEQLVDFLKEKPMFRQVNHKKFLHATVTRRSFFHVTKSSVDELTPKSLLKERMVKTLPGVSSFKQAFSVGVPNKLLVRSKICCCSFCLDRDFAQCRNKEYVEEPFMIELTKEQACTRETRSSTQHSEALGSLNQLQIGSIYVIMSEIEDIEDGFILGKCNNVDRSTVEVSYLRKYPSNNPESELFYQETGEVGQIALQSIHSSLLTANKVIPEENIYSVNKGEIEEILFSIGN